MATAVDSIRTTVVQTDFQPFVFRRPSHLVEAGQAHTIDHVRKLDILNAGTDIGSADRCSMPMDAWAYADACHGDTSILLPRQPDHFRLVDEAHALHMRRELHQALDYGFALLDALDLPPLALDVIDDAIARLDALDASDEDREDGGDSEASLGWTAAGACSGYDFDDREHDTADAELSCGWTDKVDQVHLGAAQDDHETTATELHGLGFARSGPDDSEHDDTGIGDEDGMQEQLVGWFRCPALAFSNGGYVG